MRSHGLVINLIAVLVGLSSGIAAVVFKLLINLNSLLFFDTLLPRISLQVYGYNLAVIILPALGASVAALITTRLTRESKGHGIPQVMESMSFSGGRMRYRVAPVTSIVSSITIGSGGSAGREGPIAQIGASLGSTAGQALRLSDRDVELLVVCGLASGIAATFNAPLGGAIFAIEVLLRRYRLSDSIPVLLACVLGTAVAGLLPSSFISFPALSFASPAPAELLLYAAFGLTFGVLSAIWVRYFYLVEGLFEKGRSVHKVLKIAAGGLLTGLVGMPFFMQSISAGDETGYGIYGVGYEGIVLLLAGGIPIAFALLLGVVKMLCTSFTLGSGASGGLLVPSLYVGSMFGGAVGLTLSELAPSLVPAPFALASVGAAALLAGAYGTPIASILIIPEMYMSSSPTIFYLLLPLTLSCSLAHITARKLLGGSTINTLALERRGIRLDQLAEQPRPEVLGEIQVKDVMSKNFVSVSPDTAVSKVIHMLNSSGHSALPVVESGQLLGVVNYVEAIRVPPDATERTYAKGLVRTMGSVTPDETLDQVLKKMRRYGSDIMPVVEKNRKERFLGVITRSDFMKKYGSEKQ
ncbi:MAG: chloride channel protein [Promethearchaeati archaeon SRVP18_Atabeyarchaeia-1]